MQNYSVLELEVDESKDQKLEIKNYNKTQLKTKLLDLFENEQVYKQPDLNITQVSKLLLTNRTYVSNIINKEFNTTFSDFVNYLRITEAKKLLADSTHRNFSLNHFSETSGFGSLSTFIRVFKQLEGVTPGQFRDSNVLDENNFKS